MDGSTAKDKGPLFNTSLNTPSFTFGSEAANLEYSILTAILGNSSPEGNAPSDHHSSSTPPLSVHSFSTSSSEYPASWTGVPSNSLLPSDPDGLLLSPFVTVGGIQTVFEDSRLTLPSTNRSQTGSGSPSSADFLSQTFTSIDPGSSATTSSAHTPQDSFITPVPQARSVMSPSQWQQLSSAESAYVS